MCALGQAHLHAETAAHDAEERSRSDGGDHAAREREGDGMHRARMDCGHGVGSSSARCRQSMPPATRRAAERTRRRGSVRSAVLLGVSAHLLCLCVLPGRVCGQADEADAAATTPANPSAALGPLNELCTGFSKSVAAPIKGILPSDVFYSPGWAGSPRAFFNAILTGPAEDAIDCEGGPTLDGTACSYASFLTLMIVLFGVMIPIGTTVYCMGFCCARTFIEKCHCCCALCKQPNCGSHRPTYDYEAKEKMCVGACTVFMALVFTIISLIGFLATLQVTTDFAEMISAMQAATEFPDELEVQLNTSFRAIDSGTQAFADRANDWTAEGATVTTAAVAMNNSLKALITKWEDVKRIVEGSTLPPRSLDNPCKFYYNGTTPEHRAKYDGVRQVWVYNKTVPLPGIQCCEHGNHGNCIQGSHPRGMPITVVLEDLSIANSPTCADLSRDGDNITGTIREQTRTCPCCCTCQQNIDVLEQAISRLPKNDQLALVTPVLNAQILSAIITGIGQYLKKSISTFKNYIAQLQKALEPIGDTLGDPVSLTAGAAGGWTFACLGSLLALFAWIFVNVNCWWVGYVCGWMTFFLVSVMFGVTSGLVIPFGDLCLGLPNTGEDPTPWLETFAPDLRIQSVDPVLRRLHTDCLVLTNNDNPSLWNVGGYSKRDVVGFFDDFNVSKIVPEGVSDPILATQDQLKPFTNIKAASKAMSDDSPDFWGGQYGLNEERLVTVENRNLTSAQPFKRRFKAFRALLRDALAQTQAGIADVETKQAALMAKTTELKTNLTSMRIETDKSIQKIGTDIIASSNCSRLNYYYINVRMPTCERFTKSLDAMWALFFLCGFFWFPMFYLICRGSKHTQQRRGIQKVDPSMSAEDADAAKLMKKGNKGDKYKEGGGDGDKKDGGKEKKEKKKKPKKEGGEAAPKASEEAMERKKAAK